MMAVSDQDAFERIQRAIDVAVETWSEAGVLEVLEDGSVTASRSRLADEALVEHRAARAAARVAEAAALDVGPPMMPSRVVEPIEWDAV